MGSTQRADAPPEKGRWFATTHWSVVLAAGREDAPGAAEALEQLCRAYWYPLYAYVRRCGHNPEDAQDLTQEFFLRFLEKRYFSLAQRERGKFRSFLLTSLKHFLVNEWDRARARKRGGSATHVPLDQLTAERLYAGEPTHSLTAETLYERSWAVTLLEQARARLRAEFVAEGKVGRFETLERFLPGEAGELTYAEAARRFGVAEGTLKSDVHRLKARYREVLRAEIAHTVAHPAEIADELRHLLAVLGG